MTEAIKQWIADQALLIATGSGFSGPVLNQNKQLGAISGLIKGIEIVEGFAEWADDERYIWDRKKRKHVAAWDNYSEFTTSQLLERYLETLNKEKP